MSTFRGVIQEFPDIYVDYFRLSPGAKIPLACFLSHVHTDHMQGLDTFRASFIYCSPYTKSLLHRMETRTHRLNYANDVVETRKNSYKFQEPRLKYIPMETPTEIELEPNNVIQVTLFDANHCTGSVMFLFEQDQKAVLYTGDIRAEPWFVNNLVRNPFLIEYTSGIKTLDCIYLDTSNTEPIKFPTKAEGLHELIGKAKQYPPDTIFHLSAWTFGYEEVWMALSKALGSQIHVDDYKLQLYQGLPASNMVSSTLHKYRVANREFPGSLTADQKVRLHSCEKGTRCSEVNEKTVWIQPIIARLDTGAEIREVGVGGGGGDLQRRQLDLTNLDLRRFISLFSSLDNDTLTMELVYSFVASMKPSRALTLDINHDEDELSVDQIVESVINSVKKKRAETSTQSQAEKRTSNYASLPKNITFPYSRHSSYEELCHLVRIFNPKDVYPCTVDEGFWHKTGRSIESLFGKECSGNDFRYDAELAQWVAAHESPANLGQSQVSTQRTRDSGSSSGFGHQQRNRSPSPLAQPSKSVKNDSANSSSFDSQHRDARNGSPSPLFPSGRYFRNTSASVPGGQASTQQTQDRVSSSEFGNQQHDARNEGPNNSAAETPKSNVEFVTPTKKAPKTTNASGSKVRVVRNLKGQLRPFDENGNEIPVPAKVSSTVSQNHTPTVLDIPNISLRDTPNLSAPSPGSDSQSLRRKIILDGLDEDGGDTKRMRMHDDLYVYSDMTSSKAIAQKDMDSAHQNLERATGLFPGGTISPIKAPAIPVPEQIQVSNPYDFVRNSLREVISSRVESNRQRSELSANSNEQAGNPATELDSKSIGNVGEPVGIEESNLPNSDNIEDEFVTTEDSEDSESQIGEEQAYFDPVDQVHRCKSCGHELWRVDGYCTNASHTTPCSGNLTENPYVEIGSEESSGPYYLRIAASEYDEEIEDEAVAQELGGDYLDNDLEAYDSQDSNRYLLEEYDFADSFIDDATQNETDSEPSDKDDGEDDSEGETDYKAKYKASLAVEIEQRRQLEALQQAHIQLSRDYTDMEISFTDLKQAIGIDSEEEPEGEFDEEGNLLVEVEAPEVAMAEISVPSTASEQTSFSQDSTTELVVNQAIEQSQNSMLDTQRIEDRLRGFEAAEQGAWHEVSLMSTGDNHIDPEDEL